MGGNMLFCIVQLLTMMSTFTQSEVA